MKLKLLTNIFPITASAFLTMKRISIFFLFFLGSIIVYGQKQANIWYFGNHAGLDFNTATPTPLLNGQNYFPTCCGWNEGCSSISDSSGSLLFYTNGEKVWDRFQQVMPNGNNLLGHASSTESSIIVPMPNNQRYFYVFTTDAEENNFQNGLRYSVVDMCLNGSLGDIIPTEKNIKLFDTVAEKLICIRHSNGNDYWIVSHKFNTDAFCAFKLTNAGIIDTVISHTGTSDPIGWGGQMVASPNGQKIAYPIVGGQNFGRALLLDFDATTGIVSNEQTLSTGENDYGAAFSPDNSKLYFSIDGYGAIFQYNLNAGNLAAIIASKTYILQNGPDSWRDQRLGPDGKIYLSRAGKSYISVIEYPDSLYPACNYVDSAIYLGGKYASFGLPNFIAGFDYSNTVTSCDVGIGFFENNNSASGIKIYPNPAQENITIELPGQETYNVTITDLAGRKIYESKNRKGVINIDSKEFSNGIYFVQATNDKHVFTGKIIRQ
jgi:hypothetical protein